MKLNLALWLVCASLVSTTVTRAAIIVDGTRNAGSETEYSLLAVQAQTSNWGTNNALANIYSAQTGKLLNLFVAGRADGNAIMIFIDSKPGVGVSSITNDLIRSGGFETDLNHLALDGVSGMTFETGFQPDYAIRIYGSGSAAYASLFDLNRRIRVDLGQVDNATASHGAVSQLRVNWANVGADSSTYGAAVNGVEMALNMALLGVPEGAQNVKIRALLVNSDSTYGSNQTLGSLSSSADMAAGVRTINFQSQSGTQTLTIPVNRPTLVAGDDEDGDGIINSLDPFPLDPTRSITFSVNMQVQAAKGQFAPPSAVTVQFFTGSQPELSTLTLTDPTSELIYTGTLTNVKGLAGDSFGTYKFTSSDPHMPNSGYEYGYDRTFNLGAAGTTQTLTTVYFGDESTLSYADWSTVNGGGLSADKYANGNGVPNGVAYFMGQIGSSFTANPPLNDGVVTWPRSPWTTGVSFKVLSSVNLTTWDDVTLSADTSDPAFVKYTLPSGVPQRFVRLAVTVP